MAKLDDEMQPKVTIYAKKLKLFPPIDLRPVIDKKDPLREHLRRLPKSAGN
jgi:hypothetical protein